MIKISCTSKKSYNTRTISVDNTFFSPFKYGAYFLGESGYERANIAETYGSLILIQRNRCRPPHQYLEKRSEEAKEKNSGVPRVCYLLIYMYNLLP